MSDAPAPRAHKRPVAWADVVVAVIVAGAVVAWWAVLCAVFTPGWSSNDILKQYNEGISGVYSTMHPPLHSWMLGKAGLDHGSPAPVLWLQIALTGALAALLAMRARRRAAALVLLALFLLLPPTIAFVVTLWKDVWLNIFLLLAAVALTLPRGRARFALLFVAAVGCGLFRFNALPIGMALAGVAVWQQFHARMARVIAGVIAVTVVVSAPKVVERELQAQHVWALGTLVVFDVVGIIVQKPKEYRRSPIKAYASLAELQKRYTPSMGWPLFGQGGFAGLRDKELTEKQAELSAEWWRLVRLYPGAYLRHRAQSFYHLLGIPMDKQWAPHGKPTKGKPFAPPDVNNPLYVRLTAIVAASTTTPVYKIYFWLLTLLATITAAVWRKHWVAVGYGVVVVGYFALYFFLSGAAEFRYGEPLLVSTFAMAWLLLARRES